MDYGSEDEMQIAPTTQQLPTPNSGAENEKMAKTKKTNTRANNKNSTAATAKTASKVTKAKAGGTKKAVTKKTTAKSSASRQALKDISNAQDDDGNDTEEVDEFDGDELSSGAPQMNTPLSNSTAQATKKTTASTKKQQAQSTKPTRGRAAKAVTEISEIPETQQEPVEVQSKLSKSKAGGQKKSKPTKKDEIIPETQPDPMEVDDSTIAPEATNTVDSAQAQRPTTLSEARSTSRQPASAPSRRRDADASEPERSDNDATLRRKLADMTKKFENLDVKYRALHNLSTSDADSNFKQLKKLSDEKTRASNDLITALRADLAAAETRAATTTSLEAQILDLKARNTQLTAENKKLTSTLHDTQNEVKVLQARISVNRSNSSQPADSHNGKMVPGSAAKSNGTSNSRAVLVGSAEAAKEAQKRVLKEELYSDLTGLILRDVKRNEADGEDVYDCIQTGRNGTLHFHLTVPYTASYDDGEFTYTPHLDASRDRDMLAILPDYLTEEICFPRNNAAKFYGRVVDCLTRKVVEAEEEEEREDDGGD